MMSKTSVKGERLCPVCLRGLTPLRDVEKHLSYWCDNPGCPKWHCLWTPKCVAFASRRRKSTLKCEWRKT
jgi:hypothetical protein